jgi:hypothetical protein
VPDEDDLGELIALDDLHEILDERLDRNPFIQEMDTVAHTRVAWRVDGMALATEPISDAFPAPPPCQEPCARTNVFGATAGARAGCSPRVRSAAARGRPRAAPARRLRRVSMCVPPNTTSQVYG